MLLLLQIQQKTNRRGTSHQGQLLLTSDTQKLNRKNLHSSSQSTASSAFRPPCTAPHPQFSLDLWNVGTCRFPSRALSNARKAWYTTKKKYWKKKLRWAKIIYRESEERREKEKPKERKEGQIEEGWINAGAWSLFFFSLPSLFFQFFFSLPLSNDSQWKEKAFSLSSVELHISFLLERQGGNTQSNVHTWTQTHTQLHTQEGLDWWILLCQRN